MTIKSSTLFKSSTKSKKTGAQTIKETPAHKNLNTAFYQQALSSSNLPIFILSSDGYFLFANSSFQKLLKYNFSELKRKHLHDLIRKDGTNGSRLKGKPSINLKKKKIKVHLQAKSGKEIILEILPSRIIDKKVTFKGHICVVIKTNQGQTPTTEVNEKESKLTAIFNTTDIGICMTDSEGTIVELNPAYCRTYGYSREELIGSPFTIVLAPELHAHSLALHKKILNQGPKVNSGEWEVIHKNGNVRNVFATASQLKFMNGERFIVTTVVDITERKWIEERLRYQANLIQSVSDAIISLDKNFCITNWNEAAEIIYGYKENEVIGKKAEHFLMTRYLDNTTNRSAYETLIHKGEWSGEVIQFHKNGRELAIKSKVTLLKDIHGGNIGHVAINRDITEEKQNAEEKRMLIEELQQIQKLEAIGTLSGGIAHDFNNLIAAILGNISLLKRDALNEVTQKRYERIEMAANRAASLTKQILGFARKVKLHITSIDIKQCVQNVLQIVEHTIDKRISIEIESPNHLPKIYADANQIEQTILNIVINAIDAIQPTLEQKQTGMIRFQFSTLIATELEVTRFNLLPDLEYLHIAISDTGTGISTEIQKKLFDPFFTTKEAGRGTGLGLASGYGIIKNHHGAISVDSIVGEGSTFHVYLPAEHLKPLEISTVSTPEFNQMPMSLAKTILVVDDEEMLRELLVEQLVDVGYKVHEASHGIEAIEFLKNEHQKGRIIDAIVLDMNMPKMGGARAFTEIRSLFPTMPILVATGYIQDEIVQKLLDNGLNGVLSKPYDISELLQKIADLVK